jgi:hypothetical protein
MFSQLKYLCRQDDTAVLATMKSIFVVDDDDDVAATDAAAFIDLVFVSLLI